MSWVILSILSAFFLGFYDIAKKSALRENAVLPVLFFGILTSAVIWAPFILWSSLSPKTYPSPQFQVDSLSFTQHALLVLKSALVASSWIFGYFSVKHLPLSIAAPIRSTSPLWTILLAIFLMGENPTSWQWVGIGTVLAAFYTFSLVGRLESIRFHRDKWVLFMIVATLLGAVSSIYDKYLLQNAALRPATVQAWFSVYLAVVMLPIMILWKRGTWQTGTFHWRWSIPLIGILLLIADFLYFSAISQEGALISIISPIRRGAVVITFLGGIILHKEKNFWPKACCIAVMLLGIVLIQLMTRS